MEKGTLWSANESIGANVVGAGNKELGEVEDFIMDRQNSRVAYVIVSYGGLLGIGDKHFAVPWQAYGQTDGRSPIRLGRATKTNQGCLARPSTAAGRAGRMALEPALSRRGVQLSTSSTRPSFKLGDSGLAAHTAASTASAASRLMTLTARAVSRLSEEPSSSSVTCNRSAASLNPSRRA